MIRFLLFGLLVAFVACSPGERETEKPDLTQETVPVSNVMQLNIFANEGGWGYEIQRAGKTFIRQAYIPVLSGNQPFASSEDAQKIGQLMIHKISNGIMPPSITQQELDSLIFQ